MKITVVTGFQAKRYMDIDTGQFLSFLRKGCSFAPMRRCFLPIWWILGCCLLFVTAGAQQNYQLQYHFADKDSSPAAANSRLMVAFADQQACAIYLQGLSRELQGQGYLNISVDSLRFDSTRADVWIYLGMRYQWHLLKTDPADARWQALVQVRQLTATGKPFHPGGLDAAKQNLLQEMENMGYPFASVAIDSLLFRDHLVEATLVVNEGPLYRIDSLRLTGNARIKNHYMQRYLDIRAGSVYNKSKLDRISNRLRELPFLAESQPWDMTLLGTGSTLNLYLESRRSSQLNLLIGFLPDNAQKGGKLLLTGEANARLHNALGGGERIVVDWQQLQVQSPRLNLSFQQPYMFRSAFGLDFQFGLYKKDSSFLNLNLQIGLQYLVSARQSGRIFYQLFRTNLLTVDTAGIKASKRLPPYLDASTSSLGIDYQLNTTDYRFNPLKGSELSLSASAGLRNIRKNQTIVNLVDESDPGFQFGSLYDTLALRTYLFRLRGTANYYIKLASRATLKTGLQAGWIQSENLFNNEVFQIGGYRLLRGFDEESIFASRFAVATIEYRYLIGRNSFLFVFTDGGWSRNLTYEQDLKNAYLGLGLGMSFETKAGIFNLAYAVGRRDDTDFNLRQSKIHFGFSSLF